MENKKGNVAAISFIVVILASTFGVFGWLFIRKMQPSASVQKTSENQSVTAKDQVAKTAAQEIPSIQVPVGWKLYKHDVLGIEFIYPASWGEPTTNPQAAITKLNGLADEFSDEIDRYFDSADITFKDNLDFDLPEIRIFGEKYKGEFYPNINAQSYGYIDTIGQMKKSGSVCDYKVNFNTKYNDTLNEEWNLCENGVNQMLIKNKEVFGGDTETVYSYRMKQYGYAKLKNGYFDNVFVSQDLGFASQIKKEKLTIGEFILQAKAGPLRNKSVSDEFIKQRRADFAQLVNSIHSYAPKKIDNTFFESIPGEDQNITTIRKYYWLISNGKLQDAYALYSNQKSVSFDSFKGWYGNVFFAKPLDFKSLGNNKYEFSVQYQENNTNPTNYDVVMNVSGGKIETKSSEEILTQDAVFGKYKAHAARRGNVNYLILEKDGKEKIIDQGQAQYDKNYTNIGDVKFFSNVKFSPKGGYITYAMTGWEWDVEYVYDISKQKNVLNSSGNTTFEFLSDESKFFSCSSDRTASGPGGSIYSVPSFKSVFDVMGGNDQNNYSSVTCKQQNGNIEFILNNDNWEGEGKDQKPANKTTIYSLSQNKVIQ